MKKFLSLFFIAAFAVAQEMVICPQCGHEAQPGATVCRHCHAVLPAPRPERRQAERPQVLPPSPQAQANAQKGALAAAKTAECLREARQLSKDQPAVALGYYQNALALRRLCAPAPSSGKKPADEIVEGNRAMLARLQRGWVSCRACKGTGEKQMVLRKRDGRDNKGPVGKCPACNGRGGHEGWLPADRVEALVLQGRGEFERQRIAAGDVKVGQAFLPPQLAEQLTNRERALVMTANPRPCPACGITGRQVCAACKGTGFTRCTAQGCQNGRLTEKRKTVHGVVKATRMNEGADDLCAVCDGTGEVPCRICGGRGSVPCKKCGGSGAAPMCRKCMGTGIVTCGKCKGNGLEKGMRRQQGDSSLAYGKDSQGSPGENVCPECRGEGVVMCPTCGGDGSK